MFDRLDELVDEGPAELGDFRVIGWIEPHSELVRHENAVARDDDGLRVELALERAGDLDRLQAAPKSLGEGTVDCPLKTAFEVVQKAQ